MCVSIFQNSYISIFQNSYISFIFRILLMNDYIISEVQEVHLINDHLNLECLHFSQNVFFPQEGTNLNPDFYILIFLHLCYYSVLLTDLNFLIITNSFSHQNLWDTYYVQVSIRCSVNIFKDEEVIPK